MISTEIITLIAGSITGFIFKFMARRAEDNQKKFEMALKGSEALKESRDAAAKRDGESGKWTRRVIVMSILFGVILAPFLATMLSIPVVLEVESTKSWFFGLFGKSSQPVFVQTMGYILIPEIRQSLTAIIGFYFGQGTVK